MSLCAHVAISSFQSAELYEGGGHNNKRLEGALTIMKATIAPAGIGGRWTTLQPFKRKYSTLHFLEKQDVGDSPGPGWMFKIPRFAVCLNALRNFVGVKLVHIQQMA